MSSRCSWRAERPRWFAPALGLAVAIWSCGPRPAASPAPASGAPDLPAPPGWVMSARFNHPDRSIEQLKRWTLDGFDVRGFSDRLFPDADQALLLDQPVDVLLRGAPGARSWGVSVAADREICERMAGADLMSKGRGSTLRGTEVPCLLAPDAGGGSRIVCASSDRELDAFSAYALSTLAKRPAGAPDLEMDVAGAGVSEVGESLAALGAGAEDPVAVALHQLARAVGKLVSSANELHLALEINDSELRLTARLALGRGKSIDAWLGGSTAATPALFRGLPLDSSSALYVTLPEAIPESAAATELPLLARVRSVAMARGVYQTNAGPHLGWWALGLPGDAEPLTARLAASALPRAPLAKPSVPGARWFRSTGYLAVLDSEPRHYVVSSASAEVCDAALARVESGKRLSGAAPAQPALAAGFISPGDLFELSVFAPGNPSDMAEVLEQLPHRGKVVIPFALVADPKSRAATLQVSLPRAAFDDLYALLQVVVD